MRRFLLGSIIALCGTWALSAHVMAQAGATLPAVRLIPVGEPVFEPIDRLHGLQSTAVFSVMGDPHGFIWVAGDHGVQRFDGHAFFDLDRNPDLAETLVSRFIYTIAPAANGVWIVAPNGSIQRLDARTGTLASVPPIPGINPVRFLSMESDAQGRLWRLGDRELIRLDPDGQAKQVPIAGSAMAFDRAGTRLFVFTTDHRVVMVDADSATTTTILPASNELHESVSRMVVDVDGAWLLAGQDLWRLAWKSRSLQRVRLPRPLPRSITEMVQSNDGALWFGTYEDGLWRYQPAQGTLSIFLPNPDDPHSLRSRHISALAIDHSNTLYIGMGSTGLSRLRLSQTTGAHYRVGGGKSVCAVSEIQRGTLVAGLCPGGVREIDRTTGQLRPLAAASALPGRTRVIVSDGAGGLWIGAGNDGLLHWHPDGSMQAFPFKHTGSYTPSFTGIHRDLQQRLWVAHLGGLAVLEPGARELRAVEGRIGTRRYAFGDIINDVSPGPSGSLWLGTGMGLINFDPATLQVQRYTYDRNDKTSLSDNDVLQTYTDRDGRLWIATRAGLNRMIVDRNGRRFFRRYGLNDGLPDITVSAIVADAQNALWVGTYRGIARWIPDTDRFQSYLATDGVPDNDVFPKAALLGTDGSLYFGTWTGLWRIDPKALRIADPVPVVLSSYEVGDRVQVNLRGKALSGIKAKYVDSRVKFQVAVLGDARRLSYRLEGLEDGWREMPRDLAITYHRLPPGNYSLQVRQLQHDGSWGGPDLSLPIRITPPLWRTGWAYILYAILTIGLMVAIARAFMAWRHRALREQLKESHARLSVALHAARFGMWAWDTRTNEAELDPYARELLGVAPDAKPVEDVFWRMHPDDVDRIRKQVERALTEDVTVDFEFRLPTGDPGQWRWIEGHAAPYRRDGESAYVIGVNRDATQRKREVLELQESKQAAESALEELKRSRLDLALALESGDLGVWRTGLETDARSWTRDLHIDCDSNARRIFGWTDDQDVTRGRCMHAVHPDDRRHMLERLRTVLEQGGNYTDQLRIVRPDGEVRYIAVRAVSVAAANGRGRSLTGIIHDVTSEETLKADLQQAAEQAQLATEAKGRFLAMMSHEIRTPINGVIGMVELLFETPLSEDQQQLLGICRDSAYVLLTVINDILDFSKIEAGKLTLDYAPVSPRKLVESVAESLRFQIAQKGIDLDVFIARDVPRRLLGDRIRLRQILSNLIGNAIKFTEKGGVRVYVSVKGQASGHRALIRFQVVDTGIGMDQRTLESLFQPFHQADAETTRRYGGTGLGLTIVKHLVTLMDGEIACDSAVASGSRFSVTIPMTPAMVEPEQRHGALPDLRLFALCESVERTTLLQDLCAEIDVQVEMAPSLPALLRLLERSTTPAGQRLVLLDKGFADDHDTLCRAIRESRTTASFPVLVVRREGQRSAAGKIPGVTAIAGSPLTAPALARGLRLALGLESPGVSAIASESLTELLPADSHGGEPQILLAEDNATNREVITRQLSRLGYECDVAEDGEQAWDLLRAHPDRYRLLLTDCHMPRLDGYALTQRIRREEAISGRAPLKIVAITANALLGEGERCLALGMDAFLAKPLKIPELQRILSRMIPTTANPDAGTDSDAPPSIRTGLKPLDKLTRNDDAKSDRLLAIFVSSTLADLERWSLARNHHDYDALRQLAHKLKSACRQMGDEATAAALEAVEGHAGPASELQSLADQAQRQLERTLDLMSQPHRRELEKHD